MFCLGHDQNAFRLDYILDNVGRFGGQNFLGRRPAGQHFNHPHQMRKTGDLVITRNIGNMRFTEKWQEMMFAHRIKGNVPDDNQFVAVLCGI